MSEHTFPVGVDAEVTLVERGPAGYLWDLSPLAAAGVAVARERIVGTGTGTTKLRLTLRADAPVRVEVAQRRPWLDEDEEGAVCERATFAFA